VIIHAHSWKLAAGLSYTQNPSTKIFFPISNSSLKTKYYVSPYKSLHSWFPLISIYVILFLDIGMQVGGRARESPETGDPV
jgi:hypothetical protein